MDNQTFINNIIDIYNHGGITRYELETLVDRFENTIRQDQKKKCAAAISHANCHIFRSCGFDAVSVTDAKSTILGSE